MYGEVIIEQMNNPHLLEEDNEGRKFILGTIGEWLDQYESHQKDMLLLTAEGEYLDVHGKEHNVFRLDEEDDESYRDRILLKKHLKSTSASYRSNNIGLWIYIDNLVEDEGSGLTSRNPYIDNHYLAHANPETQEYIERITIKEKGGVVEWI